MHTIKLALSFLLLTGLCSCVTKKAPANREEQTALLKTYISEVDHNKHLKKEVVEGALTDAKGYKDIGTFIYTVYFDAQTKDLYKIENVEKTNVKVTETYYFKNNKYLAVKRDNKSIETNALNFYKAKAKRFQRAFNKTHKK